MRALSIVASPIVSILGFSTDAVLRLIGLRASQEPSVTEEEIKVMIHEGTQAGVFVEAERDMVQRVFRLGDRTVASLMTRRPDMVWLDLEDDVEENRRKIINSSYSRLPVCRGELDEVVGFAHAKDLLEQSLQGQPLDLTAGLHTPVFVPETLPALKLMETLKTNRTHQVLVIDEFGVVQGLVSLHDILEAIVGDLPSVDDSDERYAIQREDGSWLVDGLLPIDEFKELFGIARLPGEETGNYQALSGFVMMQMGRIPSVTDQIELDGLRLEIMDMDGHRIDRILVRPTPDQSTLTATSTTPN
jgi:putative hemolysin